jgi:hypothetical protein
MTEDLASFTLPYLDMLVAFDDGRRLESHADQRDMRIGQKLTGADPTADPIGFNRATAWAYLNRTGVLNGTGWAEFDKTVSFVVPLPEQTGADPTGTATAE